jgi:hypothetical protein
MDSEMTFKELSLRKIIIMPDLISFNPINLPKRLATLRGTLVCRPE